MVTTPLAGSMAAAVMLVAMLRHLLAASLSFLLLAAPAEAQQRKAPYWASIRAEEVNMRVGPSSEFRVVWVYRRPGLPLKVLRLREGWRLVEDPDGARGWVAARLLQEERGVIVTGTGHATMRAEPSAGSQLKWRLQPGLVGRLEECSDGWCRISVGEYSGWVEAARLWGEEQP